MVALLDRPGQLLSSMAPRIPGRGSVASGSDARRWSTACATRAGVAHPRYPSRSARSSSHGLAADGSAEYRMSARIVKASARSPNDIPSFPLDAFGTYAGGGQGRPPGVLGGFNVSIAAGWLYEAGPDRR